MENNKLNEMELLSEVELELLNDDNDSDVPFKK